MDKLIFLGDEYEEDDVILKDQFRDYTVKDMVYLFSSTSAVTLEEILGSEERTAEFVRFLLQSIGFDGQRRQ